MWSSITLDRDSADSTGTEMTMSQGRVANLCCTIGSHSGDVTWVDFSSSILATCSSDKSIRLWNTEDFNELPSSPLLGHSYIIHNCIFSPDGDTLATCSTDGKCILWSPQSGEKLAVLQHPSNSSIRVCRFSHDGSRLVTGSDDETMFLWDIPTKQPIRMFEGHEASVVAVAFSPDDSYLVSGSPNGDLRVWDARFGAKKCLKFLLDGHDLGVTGCAFSSSNALQRESRGKKDVTFLLATCGYDNLIKLWDFFAQVRTPHVKLQQRTALSGHDGHIMGICFSPCGDLLASAAGDKTVRLWNPQEGLLVYVIEAHSRYVTSCAFSRDGLLLATGSNDKQVKVWQILGEDELKAATVCTDEVQISVSEPAMDLSSSIDQLTVDDVSSWLKDLGMPQYAEQFRKNAIDGTELSALTHESLEKDLGVVALGHRNKILRAVASYKEHPYFPAKTVDEEGLPDEFLCPITRELMRDPVIASDGHTYERLAISSWMKKGKTSSPMTNQPLNRSELVPNHSLKMLIQRYLQQKQSS